MKSLKLYLLFTFLFLQSLVQAQQELRDSNLVGRMFRYEKFASNFVDARNVDVWLPSNFDYSGNTKYAVLYVHDGQNLFMPGYSFAGEEWRLDETMDSLLRLGIIRKTIVVGIWNTPKRFLEYNPQDAFDKLDTASQSKLKWERGGSAISNAYLEFIFTELKPFIDQNYPTKADMKNTFMMGSSMGGLISLYALCKHSDMLKGVACISTHWPVSLKENNERTARTYIEYYANRLPNPKQHKIYFDCGSETLDSWYLNHQDYMDELCLESGYGSSKDFMSLRFMGAQHNEKAWQKRVGIPLKFLLQP